METDRRSGMDRRITDRGPAARGKDIIPSVPVPDSQQVTAAFKPDNKDHVNNPRHRRTDWEDRHHHV